MKSAFAGYHPAVNFFYFTLVLVMTMFLLHPVCLAIGLLASLAWFTSLRGWRALGKRVLMLIPLLVMTVLLNPLFSHQGSTILAYFPWGKPLTLEALCFGLASAALLCVMMSWFSCYNEIMTTDKFVYLFGRVLPSLSLLLSMALRFVPRFTHRLKTITAAQRGLGLDLEHGKLRDRAKQGIRILSILITWCLEDAVETADSMKNRGYGLKGRSTYARYRLDRRDGAALAWLGAIGLAAVGLWIKGGFAFDYFPSLRTAPLSPWTLAAFVVYALLCLTPLIIDRWEDRKWNYSTCKG